MVNVLIATAELVSHEGWQLHDAATARLPVF